MDAPSHLARGVQQLLESLVLEHGLEAPAVLREWADKLERIAH